MKRIRRIELSLQKKKVTLLTTVKVLYASDYSREELENMPKNENENEIVIVIAGVCRNDEETGKYLTQYKDGIY